MPNVFFGKPKGDMMEFDEHETEHLKVVRVEEGERVEVTDGKGILYKVVLRKISKKKSYGDIVEAHRVEALSKQKMVLYVGSSSWERLRILIEKAVELGADGIVVYRGDKSKRDYTRKGKKVELVVRDAAKQCRRFYFPYLKFLHSACNIPEHATGEELLILERDGLPLREADLDLSNGVGIIVGPEGGFSENERRCLERFSRVISLGRRILRFETAGIAAMALFSYLMGKM